ncbi:MAG: sorting protein, partial [Verrucomicrobiales bacterium]|nr:sorting protein [Verrucomicrobiales bacterium]
VSAQSADPDPGDNSKWRFGTFPTQGTANKTSGAEFRLSTFGRQAITMNWEHYNSATGNRYWRVQYSTDGIAFIDHLVFTNILETNWGPAFTASFTNVSGVDNNPNFAVRLVSEFESTATGVAGNDNYKGVQTSGGYSTGGTLWLDSVTFTGLPAALPPPAIHVTQAGSNVQLSWPTIYTGFALEHVNALGASWQVVPEQTVQTNGSNIVNIQLSTTNRFFRLKK